MLEQTLKAALTKEQQEAGLHLSEPDDHTLTLKNREGKVLALFGAHATVEHIRTTTQKFLL